MHGQDNPSPIEFKHTKPGKVITNLPGILNQLRRSVHQHYLVVQLLPHPAPHHYIVQVTLRDFPASGLSTQKELIRCQTNPQDII